MKKGTFVYLKDDIACFGYYCGTEKGKTMPFMGFTSDYSSVFIEDFLTKKKCGYGNTSKKDLKTGKRNYFNDLKEYFKELYPEHSYNQISYSLKNFETYVPKMWDLIG